MYEELLEDAYDLHVHTGPDVVPRKIDDLEYAERLTKLGMKGFGIKSHYFPTAERARIINKLYPGFNAIGAITLNNSVGGINPAAVETAGKDGAKIVWMPTFNADNEVQYLFNQGGYDTLPPWAEEELKRKKEGRPTKSITILKENGELKASMYEILDLIAEFNLVLATGHLSKKEIFTLAKEIKKHNIKKFVVTHPTFSSIALTKKEQKELTELGAYMNQCYGVIDPQYGITWNKMYQIMHYVGPKNMIFSSDLGQTHNPFPEEGLIEFIDNLLNNGFTKQDIKRMNTENTSFLVES